MTEWIDMPNTRGNEDRPLDAGTCHGIFDRLRVVYEQSTSYINVVADPPEQASSATTSTSAWAWIGHPIPILCRTKDDGDPRDIGIECQAKGSTADTWTLRAYLLGSRGRPTLDPDDGVLGVYSSAVIAWAVSSAAYSYKTSPGALSSDYMGPPGTLYGDGYIAGHAQPVWWLSFCHKGTAAITVSIRDISYWEEV